MSYIDIFNKLADKNISGKLNDLLGGKKPIFVCIGSDLVLGDSLGPLVGTFLKQKKLNTYIYGTLNFPITAKEIEYAGKYIKLMHKDCKIVAIDAAVGNPEDVGSVKIINGGIKPGLGVNKNLSEIGDISIIGIVASKSVQNVSLYNLTRLNLIYKLANVIASGIEDYINEITIWRKDKYVSAKQKSGAVI